MASETDTFNGTLSSQYDLADRRTRLAWPDGNYVDYVYDAAGQMTEVRENGAASGPGRLALYAYDDHGRRTSLTRGNGTLTSYTYDNVSRLSVLTQDLTGTTNDVTLGYGYNPASEIESNTRSNDAYSFTLANANVASTANGLNQLTAIGGASVTHDARGNVASIGSAGYGYYAENRMSVATAISGGYLMFDPADRLSFIYNPADGSGTAARQYSGHELVLERTIGGAVRRRYVFGADVDEPLVWYEGTGLSDRRWLHADERGSVIAVSDGSGDPAGSINRYDDYGAPQGGAITGRFGYTGQVWLPELSMYDYRARFYNPAFGGRFMQTDPIGYEGGMNLYAYVGNNPVNFTDPMGLQQTGGQEQPGGQEIVVTGPSTSFRPLISGAIGRFLLRMATEAAAGGSGQQVTVVGDRCAAKVTNNPGRGAFGRFEYDGRQALAASAAAFLKHNPTSTTRSRFGGDVRTPVGVFNAINLVTPGSFAVPASSGGRVMGRRLRVTSATGMIVGYDIYSGNRHSVYNSDIPSRNTSWCIENWPASSDRSYRISRMPEMINVDVLIEPNLSEFSGSFQDLSASPILPYSYFDGCNIDVVVSFVFGDIIINYDTCKLYDYYLDICDELDKLESGDNHDIEMSGYPVAIAQKQSEDTIKIVVYYSAEQDSVEKREAVVSAVQFRHKLLRARQQIEDFIGCGGRISDNS